ncbi:MAG: ABC-F family ATP-binding cassette domain-containing protein [Bacilli bacterium]|nr:ABC-F family ATP-binding cassette domain-containing protein [Bacilli bacterium]
MIVLALQNVIKEYNGERLFNPVTFRVDQKERVALIGINGTGKSTILKMIVGKEEVTSGKIITTKNCSIGYLSQEVISSMDNTLYEEVDEVFDYLKEKKKKLEELEEKLALNPEDENLISSYALLESDYSSLGGYDYQYKIDMMLFKFGFNKQDYSRKISTFSGGERMKAAFIKLLLISPDLLILDEPTNHLDIQTIEWLEEYLKSYSGSLLFVSHDRYFINALATKILELDQKNLEEYVGNYDRYSVLKKERYEHQLELYKRQQAQAEKLKWFISFYMPKPRFVSRAHDREKKLARLEKQMVDKPTLTKSKVNINITGSSRKGRKEIEVEDVSIGYDNIPLVSDINFTLFGGDKMAIMGANGTGKTTFIKSLMQNIKPLKGEMRFLESISIGYLKQDTLVLDSDETIFDYIKDRFPRLSDQEVYNHLGSYGFSYEDDKKIITNLSGGERMRVVLAEMVLHSYTLLILDEPTNHLDMITKEELIEALNSYKGTLLVVTHDRYFADQVCSRLLYFFDSKAYLYEGRYSDFKIEVLDLLEKEKEEKELLLKKEEKKVVKTIYKPQHEQKVRPRLSQDKIEEKLTRIEKNITSLRKHFDEEEYYLNPQKMEELNKEIAKNEEEYSSLITMLEAYDL